MAEVLVRYLHFLGIIVLSASLVSEHLLLSFDTSTKKLRRLAAIDGVFGMSALTVLVAGLLLWFVVGKPSEFYTHNWIFHIKLTLFAVIGCLSVFPTIFFIRHRNSSIDQVVIPKSIVMIVRTELALLLCVPLFATFMARGYGLTS
jgi:putative membrane protein